MQTIWTKTMNQVMRRYSRMDEEEACIWIRGLLRCVEMIRSQHPTTNKAVLDDMINEVLMLDIYPYNPVVYQVGLGYASAQDIVESDILTLL